MEHRAVFPRVRGMRLCPTVLIAIDHSPEARVNRLGSAYHMLSINSTVITTFDSTIVSKEALRRRNLKAHSDANLFLASATRGSGSAAICRRRISCAECRMITARRCQLHQ